MLLVSDVIQSVVKLIDLVLPIVRVHQLEVPFLLLGLPLSSVLSTFLCLSEGTKTRFLRSGFSLNWTRLSCIVARGIALALALARVLTDTSAFLSMASRFRYLSRCQEETICFVIRHLSFLEEWTEQPPILSHLLRSLEVERCFTLLRKDFSLNSRGGVLLLVPQLMEAWC